MKTFTTSGTCARAINYEVENGVVTQCTFAGVAPAIHREWQSSLLAARSRS